MPERVPGGVPGGARALANATVLGVTLGSTGVLAWAFSPERAGHGSMLAAIGVFYAVLAALALRRLHRRGELGARFRPAYGDITLGAAAAGALYGGARIVASLLAANGSVRELWIRGIYEQLGDPDAPGRMLVGVAVLVVAALEEIVWRGLVMLSIQDVAPRDVGGARGRGAGVRAATISSLLYAGAHLPTLTLLRVPVAGYNPLLVLAALGCGMVWSAIVLRTGRLLPAVIAHALFSWSIVEFPLWLP